ncbi:MAG TPA: beta-propeller fold lactonase family protein [Devosiaceae bacterium]|jgi:6-phosphogluconolactonase
MASSYFAVVCNSAGNSLSLYDLDAAGKLTQLREMPLEGVGAPSGAYSMTLSPDRSRLYVAFRGTPYEVLTYAIDSRAKTLTLIGRSPLADSMAHVATDSAGRFLLSASYGGGKVSVNPIGPNGVVMAPTDTIEVAPNMHCCIPVPNSDEFFAASLGDDSVLKFRFDAAGKLTRLPARAEAAAGSDPRHFVFHPSMRWGYLVTQTTAVVDIFGFDGSVLTDKPLQSISILPPNWQGQGWAADIRITPDGRFLYASDRNANSVATFAVDANSGRLTAAGHTYAAAWPRGFNLAPDGKFLVALGENSNLVDVFAIDPSTGTLDKRHTLPTGAAPSWVEVLAS